MTWLPEPFLRRASGWVLQAEITSQYSLRQAGTGCSAAIRTHSQLTINLPAGVCCCWLQRAQLQIALGPTRNFFSPFRLY